MAELGTLLRDYVETTAPRIDVDALVDEIRRMDDGVTVLVRPPRRRPVIAALAAFAVAIAVGAAAWVGWLALTDGDEIADTTTSVPSATTTTLATATTTPGDLRSSIMLETGQPMYTGHDVKLAVTPDGGLFAVYLTGTADDEFGLTFTTCEDTTCTSVSGTSTMPIAGWAQPPAVAVGPEGDPTVVFIEERGPDTSDSAEWSMLVITCHDAGCQDRTVNNLGPGGSPQISIGPDGNPLVVYVGDDGFLTAQCADRTCESVAAVTDLEGTTRWAGFYLGAIENDLAIAHTYRDDELFERFVVLTRCLDTTCADRVDIAEIPVGSNMLMGFDADPSGNPAFLLVDETGFQLSMVRCADPECGTVERPVLIGPRQNVGHEAAFAIPGDGRPVIAFAGNAGERRSEEAPAEVVIAKCDDITCETGLFHALEDAGDLWRVTFALDGVIPVVAYYSPPGDLGIVRCADPSCAVEAIDAGTWSQDMPLQEPQDLGPILEGWMGIEVEGLPGRGGGGLSDIAHDNTRVVAVGSSARSLADGSSMDQSAVAVVADLSDPFSWELVLVDAGAFQSVVTGGPGFVAAGSTCGDFEEQDPDCRPGIWTSPDGRTWNPAPADAFAPVSECPWEFCQVRMDSLATSGGLFVATGLDGQGTGVWRSDDGTDWARVDLAELLSPSAWIDQVAPFQGGFLAFGGVGEDIFDEQGEWIDWHAQPLVLRSADGATWERVSSPVEAPTVFFDRATPWDGGLLVRADACDETWECSPTLVHTLDGTTWTTPGTLPDTGEGHGRIYGLGTLAVYAGSHYDPDLGLEQGIFAVSTDLIEWMVYTADPAVFGDGGGLNELIRLPEGTIVGAGAPGGPGALLSGIYVWPPSVG